MKITSGHGNGPKLIIYIRVQDELRSSAERHSYVKVDVAFEVLDLSIEMKNQLKLGRDIQDLTNSNDKVRRVHNCFFIIFT